MAIEKVKAYFKKHRMEERIQELDMSSATVELAAAALHCEPQRIAETLVGHAVGGVCPFAVNEGVDVYLDVSLKRFETVFCRSNRKERNPSIVCETYRQSTENLKSYMQCQWGLVGGMAGTFREME